MAYSGKGIMKDNHNEAKVGTEAFTIFADQFGKDDIYRQIILETLLEELLSYKCSNKRESSNQNRE